MKKLIKGILRVERTLPDPEAKDYCQTVRSAGFYGATEQDVIHYFRNMFNDGQLDNAIYVTEHNGKYGPLLIEQKDDTGEFYGTCQYILPK